MNRDCRKALLAEILSVSQTIAGLTQFLRTGDHIWNGVSLEDGTRIDQSLWAIKEAHKPFTL